MSKPKFDVYTCEKYPTPIEAFQVLHELNTDLGNHLAEDLRPPLGIYNVSLTRLGSRLEKCCSKLEQLFKISSHVDVVYTNKYLLEEVLDYLELSLYAAAEHVDDLKSIVNGFSDKKKKLKKSNHNRSFFKKLNAHEAFISKVVNKIKHQQARIRLFSLEVEHDTEKMCLHGYFIEGVNQGEVGPNKIFHGDNSTVFSITSIVWEIICFVLKTSRDLKELLIFEYSLEPNKTSTGNKTFLNSILAAARLPLYSFDDQHPFLQTNVTIHTNVELKKKLESGLYGSITKGWNNSKDMHFFTSASSYEGDDVTKSFKLVSPKSVKLQHWT